ncbi:MAG: pilus assembly protein, partial [Chloroflexota bacterium]|nr:pilus assembly protein [Chloroflexota bacterium]
MPHRSPLRSDERGQSVVETALSLPIMTVMLLGSFEGVRILLAAIALTSGVLAGAEYGA